MERCDVDVWAYTHTLPPAYEHWHTPVAVQRARSRWIRQTKVAQVWFYWFRIWMSESQLITPVSKDISLSAGESQLRKSRRSGKSASTRTAAAAGTKARDPRTLLCHYQQVLFFLGLLLGEFRLIDKLVIDQNPCNLSRFEHLDTSYRVSRCYTAKFAGEIPTIIPNKLNSGQQG